jgi:hypothetical protein
MTINDGVVVFLLILSGLGIILNIIGRTDYFRNRGQKRS